MRGDDAPEARLFLAYAAEQIGVAEELSQFLRNHGYQVFFDRERGSLPPGQEYVARIRDAIETSELMVFLVSPDAVRSGAYAMSELEIARKAWPNPQGHLLPVMIQDTPIGSIPAYLRSVTILRPKGNVIAETVLAAERLVAGIDFNETIATQVRDLRAHVGSLLPLIRELRGALETVLADLKAVGARQAVVDAERSLDRAEREYRSHRPMSLFDLLFRAAVAIGLIGFALTWESLVLRSLGVGVGAFLAAPVIQRVVTSIKLGWARDSVKKAREEVE